MLHYECFMIWIIGLDCKDTLYFCKYKLNSKKTAYLFVCSDKTSYLCTPETSEWEWAHYT